MCQIHIFIANDELHSRDGFVRARSVGYVDGGRRMEGGMRFFEYTVFKICLSLSSRYFALPYTNTQISAKGLLVRALSTLSPSTHQSYQS